MKLAVTVVKEASKLSPLVLRGDYSSAIRRAAQIGYDAVELHIADPDELDLAEVRSVCETSGISVSSIGTGLAFVRDALTLTSPNPSIQQQARARLKAFVRLGAELNGVVIIGLIKGYVRDCADRSTYEQLLSDALDECLPIAQECQATIVLEAVNRYECDTLNTIAECVQFIQRFRSDSLKLHIDTFHMNIEEDYIGANIRAAGQHIGHVHVADSHRGYPGSGHYDFAETIAALKAINYQSALSLECLALPTPDEAATKAHAFLRRAIA